MRLTIERDAALNAMTKVRGLVGSTNTIPILGNVLLTAKGDQLTVRSANADMQIVAPTVAEIDTPGTITVPGVRLHDLLRSLPAGGEVQLALTEHRLNLSCGRSKFHLPTLPASDFPELSSDGAAHTVRMPAAELRRLAERTAFAICTEETRYYMGGLHLTRVTRDDLTVLDVVATDGSRLARAWGDCPEGWMAAPPITIPRKAVAEILRLIDGVKAEVSLATNGSLVWVAIDGVVELVSKLVDGRFPDYARAIPGPSDQVVVADVEQLTAGLKRCEIMAADTDKTKSVRFAVRPNELAMTARDGQGGDGEDLLDVEYAGEPIDLSFNGRYLADIIGQMHGETVRLELSGAKGPTRVLDPTDPRALYVIMPQLV